MHFSQLLKLSRLLKYGLLAIVGGLGLAGFAFYSDTNIPERAQLETVEGVVTGGKKVTTTRRRGGKSVKYELALQTKDNATRTITIPESHISESALKRTLGEAVVFEIDGDSDVFVIKAAGRELLSYDQSVKSRHGENSGLEMIGGIIAGLGALVAGLGYLLAKRKAKKLIAEWEAEQAAHRAAQEQAAQQQQPAPQA